MTTVMRGYMTAMDVIVLLTNDHAEVNGLFGRFKRASKPETKQELLELRSTSERLNRLRDLLARVVGSYEERARLHSLARGNGHAGKKIEIE